MYVCSLFLSLINVSALQKAPCRNWLTFTVTSQVAHTHCGLGKTAVKNFVGVSQLPCWLTAEFNGKIPVSLTCTIHIEANGYAHNIAMHGCILKANLTTTLNKVS